MKTKWDFSKFIVGLVITLNILFTIAVLCVFARVGSEPTILVGAWFTFTTSELLALSSIKKKKIIKEEKNNGIE